MKPLPMVRHGLSTPGPARTPDAASTSAADPLRAALDRAARWRFVAALLEPPRPGRQDSLRALARELPAGERIDARTVLLPDDEWVEAEHERLLGVRGRLSTFSSDHVEGGFADKGPILGDIAGFYRAFGFEPALPEPPDHFATLFQFLSFLALKEAYALHEGLEEERAIAEDAGRKLFADHILRPLRLFLEKLDALALLGGVFAGVGGTVAALVPEAAPPCANAPARDLTSPGAPGALFVMGCPGCAGEEAGPPAAPAP